MPATDAKRSREKERDFQLSDYTAECNQALLIRETMQ